MIDLKVLDLPFEEAIAFFEQKGLKLSPNSWRDLWEAAHSYAFTVARVTAMDVLLDLYEAMLEALDSGLSLKSFQDGIEDLLKQKGWWADDGDLIEVEMPDGTIRKRLTSFRLENIYRTNAQSAYSVGRYKQMSEVADVFPYWQYKGIDDRVTRDDHRAMQERVYRADDPIWEVWYPLNGYQCRCWVRIYRKKDLEKLGLKVQTEYPKDKDGKAILPDEGWRYNVGKKGMEAWQPDWDKYPEPLRTQLRESLKKD